MDTLNSWVMTAASWLFVLQAVGLSMYLIGDWLFGEKRSSGHCAECERRQRFRDGWPPEVDYHG